MHSPDDKHSAPTATTSSSYPDLRNIITNDDLSSITMRKRKKPEDYNDFKEEITKIHVEINTLNNHFTEELSKFRTDMLSFLENFAKNQIENTSQIRQDLIDVKTQLTSINQFTDSLATEQKAIKSDLSKLEIKSNQTEQKLLQLETHVNMIKTNTLPDFKQREDLVLEIQERYIRSKNVIFAGIPELEDVNKSDRLQCEKQQVFTILKSVYESDKCPNIMKCWRLGKYNPGKTRLIKVCLESQETALFLLRNKDKLTNQNISIFSDQTPSQQKYLQEIKSELNRRQENGESDICIKYVKGIPTITKTHSKN